MSARASTSAAGRGALAARRIPPFAFLVVVWVALWGDFSVANVLGGIAVAAAVSAVFPDAGPRPSGGVQPLAALRFAGWFAVALVRATVAVAVEVVRPAPRLSQGIVAVTLRGASDALATLVANAISLTPGTLTLEVETDRDVATLYVHCLRVDDMADVRRELEHLGDLAVQAFGSRQQREVNDDPETGITLDPTDSAVR